MDSGERGAENGERVPTGKKEKRSTRLIILGSGVEAGGPRRVDDQPKGKRHRAKNIRLERMAGRKTKSSIELKAHT